MPHDFKNYPELTNQQMQELQFQSPHKQITEDFFATVVKVHDGDTITLRTSFRNFDFPIRFANIDAPELKDGGSVTADWVRALLENKEVWIMIDIENRVDKWGRLLGRVVYNGLDVGEQEIYLGLAKPYGKQKEGEVPQSYKYLELKRWL